MENPLLEVKTPIPFDAVRAEHVAPATDALLERSQAALRSEEHTSELQSQ